MPEIGYNIQPQSILDLASIAFNARQIKQQKRQQQMANLISIVDAVMNMRQFGKTEALEKQKFGLQEREQNLKEQPQLSEIANAAWMAKMTGDEEGFQRYSQLYTDVLNKRISPQETPQGIFPLQQSAIPNLQAYKDIAMRQKFPLTRTMNYLSSLPQNQPISQTTGIGTPEQYAYNLFSKLGLQLPENSYRSAVSYKTIVNKYGLEE